MLKVNSDSGAPIALVLSGGGALGAAHVGVARAIEGRFRPEYLIGTSAGAIVASALACGMKPLEISNYLRDKSLLKVAFDFSFKGSGIIRGAKILDLLNKIYEERCFEDLPANTNLSICATDFDSGKEVILKTGSIAEAVRASLAVPGLFEPYWINGIPLVDGGLVNNLPLSSAIREYKGDKILAVDVCTSISEKFSGNSSSKVSLRGTIERALRIMFLHQQKSIPSDPRVIFIRPDVSEFGTADILHLKEIDEIGFKAVNF